MEWVRQYDRKCQKWAKQYNCECLTITWQHNLWEVVEQRILDVEHKMNNDRFRQLLLQYIWLIIIIAHTFSIKEL